MSIAFAGHVRTRNTVTPQTEAIAGREAEMVKNDAGGYCFPVDDWTRLGRFLVLGSEGNTYYATERVLTKDNTAAVQRCIDADGKRAVDTIVGVSETGRAPKNDPAIFALALAASAKEVATRGYALMALPRVCRTGTHILHFAEFVQGFRGWGRALRGHVASWYQDKDPGALAYQLAKYQGRDGWTQRDLLRLSHPVPPSEVHKTLFHWATHGWDAVGDEPHPEAALRIVWAMERAKRATDAKEVCRLIRDHGITREMVPTQFLKDAAVWEALLVKMPLEAMVRNLGNMTKCGLVAPLSEAAAVVCNHLADADRIRKARLHPIKVLAALKTYAGGHGVRGRGEWTPVQPVVDALDGSFYAAFVNVEPTGKRWFLAVDVSGSMDRGEVAGVPGLTPRIGAAALAMVTARVEPTHLIAGFACAASGAFGGQWGGGEPRLAQLNISPRMRLDSVCATMQQIPMGGTDCSLPMRAALAQNVPVDVFCLVTDNETWAGPVHPVEALRQYRKATGIPAKLIVLAMTPTQFSIADPSDGGCLDCVGFSTDSPAVMADFVRG